MSSSQTNLPFDSAQGTRLRASGFGLLEVIISAGILATVIGASVGLMNTSLRRATLAANRATAMNLAQEAIELAKAARETTYIDAPVALTGTPNQWDSLLGPGSTSVGTRVGGIWTTGDSYALAYVPPTETSAGYHWQLAKSGPSLSGTISSGVETITIDGQAYQREVYVTLPGINYPKVACLRPPDSPTLACDAVSLDEQSVIRKITVVVRWGASITEAVSAIEYLTNWRSS